MWVLKLFQFMMLETDSITVVQYRLMLNSQKWQKWEVCVKASFYEENLTTAAGNIDRDICSPSAKYCTYCFIGTMAATASAKHFGVIKHQKVKKKSTKLPTK